MSGGKKEYGGEHSGHRERMRERYFNDGNFDNFSDVNILETILFYAIPVKDTNGIAHNLLEAFGSLGGVFNAPVDALREVRGVTPNAANLIAMVPGIAKAYLDSENKNLPVIRTKDDSVRFLRPKFTGAKKEMLYIIALDNRSRILKCRCVSEGGVNSTDANIRMIVSELLTAHATNAIIAHNHPFGVCAPSREDCNLTARIAVTLANIDIRLADHIIIADGDAFSFASHEKLKAFLMPDRPGQRFADDTMNTDSKE